MKREMVYLERFQSVISWSIVWALEYDSTRGWVHKRVGAHPGTRWVP